MEFTDLLAEWLGLRDIDLRVEAEACGEQPRPWPRSLHQRQIDRERMSELAHEMNKRMRGEL